MAAIAVVVGGLALTSWGLWHKAKAADQRAEVAEHQRDQARQQARDAELQIAEIRRYQVLLDERVRERDARLEALAKAKKALQGQYDELKKTLPQEDQVCLDRALPDAVAARLRD